MITSFVGSAGVFWGAGGWRARGWTVTLNQLQVAVELRRSREGGRERRTPDNTDIWSPSAGPLKDYPRCKGPSPRTIHCGYTDTGAKERGDY